ncbi:MAG: hypothetical protein WBN68_05530 [Sedimenticolaceae bacterium]
MNPLESSSSDQTRPRPLRRPWACGCTPSKPFEQINLEIRGERSCDLAKIPGDGFLVQLAPQRHRLLIRLGAAIEDSLTTTKADASGREIVQAFMIAPVINTVPSMVLRAGSCADGVYRCRPMKTNISKPMTISGNATLQAPTAI